MDANFGVSSPAAITWRTRPRTKRSRRSSSVSMVVAGITTAPSFIAASIASHSGCTLPSSSRMRSPRRTPRARRWLATWFDRADSAAKLMLVSGAPGAMNRSADASLPAAMRSK